MNEKLYSQCGEDKFVFDFFNRKSNGFLVDVGAADGITGSNSKFLIENGWSGLLIEPNLNQILKLENLYLNKKNVIIENVACSYENKKNVEFYIDGVDGYELCASLDIHWAKRVENIYSKKYKTSNCDLVRTSDIFEKYNIYEIDFLSVDTEGFDFNVLKGIDFNKTKIKLICIETVTSDVDNLLLDKFDMIHKTKANFFFKNKKI